VKTVCAVIGACLLASAIAVLGLAAVNPVRRPPGASARDGRAKTKVVLQAAGERRLARENPARSR